MVHSLPLAGGSHQRAFTAIQFKTYRGSERDEGKRKRELIKRRANRGGNRERKQRNKEKAVASLLKSAEEMQLYNKKKKKHGKGFQVLRFV